MSLPSLSIILPTYNGSRFIAQAIDSVQKQTFPDWELIVIDDGSTDDTAHIIQTYVQNDPRITIIKQVNAGQGAARKNGIARAQGAYIALIDDDDIWQNPLKLENQMAFLFKHPDHVLVGSAKTELIDEDGKHIAWYENPQSDEDIRNHMLLKNCFITSSVVFSKAAYEAVGGFSDMRLSEDYELWLRMGKEGKLVNVDRADVAYRVRRSSSSASRRLKLCANTLTLIVRNRKKYPHFLRAYTKGILRFPYYLLKQNKPSV